MHSTIQIVHGDMFEGKHEALVNPVNCVGTLGGGLAADFRDKYPRYAKEYYSWCKEGKMKIGTVIGYKDVYMDFVLLSFPTKDHWKQPSKYEYISAAMPSFIERVGYYGVRSVGIPALGCGLGGLDWTWVRGILVDALEKSELDNVTFTLYEP